MKKANEAASIYEAVASKKANLQRVAIFMRNWMEVSKLSAAHTTCSLKSWKRGETVFSESDVERLLSLNAPVKVFIEDVD
jgi:hypothetical protein